MKKYLLVSVIAALSLVSMFVQADNFNELQRNLGRTLYPSPSVTQIKRYGEYPISPATGIPKIELPLYTIELDGLCIPISISYHASGIKVNDVASPVGLGWVLNAGGLISRDVRGGVDRICPISSGVSCVKFMNEEDVIDAIKGTQVSCNDFRRIIKGSDLEDTESDRYYYSFLGKSGIFRHVFERDNLYDIKTIPFSLLDIDEYVKNHTSGYKITDTDGTQYYFDQEEYCSCSQFGSQQIAWHLTKIVTPNSKDTVIFDYLTHTGASYSVTTGSEYAHTEISNVNGMRWGYLRMKLSQNIILYEPYLNGWDLNFRNEFMVDVVNYDTPLLKTIRWRGHSVEFVYSEDRNDHLFGNNPLARLKYMTVKSGESDTIKVVSFDNNSYLGDFDRSLRMLLAGINIGNCESSQVEKYSFSYDLSPLPNY
ncbi:MAG: hypothetical protein Q4A15_07380, partial [Prevotellaceae bacterium]|nr:hypothetical protein [Prevotellaceae bacterium]